jgi:hypothetical protein
MDGGCFSTPVPREGGVVCPHSLVFSEQERLKGARAIETGNGGHIPCAALEVLRLTASRKTGIVAPNSWFVSFRLK